MYSSLVIQSSPKPSTNPGTRISVYLVLEVLWVHVVGCDKAGWASLTLAQSNRVSIPLDSAHEVTEALIVVEVDSTLNPLRNRLDASTS